MDNLITVKSLSTQLGGTWIHRDINFEVKQGEITAIIGGSGCGKSTLLREILSLLRPVSGTIEVFGHNILTSDEKTLQHIQQRCGVLFQQGALFSSLTVLENIIFPMQRFTPMNLDNMKKMALLKLAMVGLGPETANKFPSELSGGMQKRVALARALALDPELLFLDEPASGLDPISAAAQDELLMNLKKTLALTVLMVTHDLDTLKHTADRIIFLGEKKVLAMGTFEELRQHTHPEIHAFFLRNA